MAVLAVLQSMQASVAWLCQQHQAWAKGCRPGVLLAAGARVQVLNGWCCLALLAVLQSVQASVAWLWKQHRSGTCCSLARYLHGCASLALGGASRLALRMPGCVELVLPGCVVLVLPGCVGWVCCWMLMEPRQDGTGILQLIERKLIVQQTLPRVCLLLQHGELGCKGCAETTNILFVEECLPYVSSTSFRWV